MSKSPIVICSVVTLFCLRYVDFKFAQTQNECGVIAGVQLLHIMATRSQEKEMLNLLQITKDITFRFMQKMAITGEAIDTASKDDAPSGNDRRIAKQLCDDFNRLQLQEAFKCFLEWMDRNCARSLRNVQSIVEELQERASFLY